MILITCLLALAGCTTNPITPTVITETKYVVRQPSEELLVMPQRTPDSDVEVTTDNEGAKWIIQTEAYIEALESKFEKLVTFIRNPPKQD